ncbi:MAG TPA: hypothetical protein VMH39_08025 [Gemmatimonadaceae bacterium]|nr:hypothetical protein [Gemmatimonadaceae bacterium]
MPFAVWLALAMPLHVARSPSPQAVTIGRVTAVSWPGGERLATLLAETADRTTWFAGLGPVPDRPIRLFLAPNRALFDSLTHGRLPEWSEGAAFPEERSIVLLSSRSADRVFAALRHELAHLALHSRLTYPPPLWFDEGYAAFAAGEWDRLEVLRLNWQIARGVQMNLDQIDLALRSDEPDAQTAYALATTAVALLNRWGGGGRDGLRPLIDALASKRDFDAALRSTYHITESEFETRWQGDVASGYGYLSWMAAVGLFWTVLAIVLVWLVFVRRRRDRARRASLDEGWVIPEDWPSS